MDYGTCMARMLASLEIAKEVEGVVRQKNGGLRGRENRTSGDEVPASADRAGGDVGI